MAGSLSNEPGAGRGGRRSRQGGVGRASLDRELQWLAKFDVALLLGCRESDAARRRHGCSIDNGRHRMLEAQSHPRRSATGSFASNTRPAHTRRRQQQQQAAPRQRRPLFSAPLISRRLAVGFHSQSSARGADCGNCSRRIARRRALLEFAKHVASAGTPAPQAISGRSQCCQAALRWRAGEARWRPSVQPQNASPQSPVSSSVAGRPMTSWSSRGMHVVEPSSRCTTDVGRVLVHSSSPQLIGGIGPIDFLPAGHPPLSLSCGSRPSHRLSALWRHSVSKKAPSLVAVQKMLDCSQSTEHMCGGVWCVDDNVSLEFQRRSSTPHHTPPSKPLRVSFCVCCIGGVGGTETETQCRLQPTLAIVIVFCHWEPMHPAIWRRPNHGLP